MFNFDDALQKKIQIIYRVSYLKDSIFGKDDPSSMRSATILYNTYSASMIEGILANKSVVSLFQHSPASQEGPLTLHSFAVYTID
jgi:hypothetical protein